MGVIIISMEEQLLGFPKQFSWEPNVEGKIPSFTHAILCGMGGSALQAKLLLAIDPSLPFSIHQDYGLPFITEGEQPLIILSSYSGDTEEMIDGLKEATARNLPRMVITSGGTLLAFAREQGIPSIELPKAKVEPRMAIGYAMLALLHALGKTSHETKLRTAGGALDVPTLKSAGEALVGKLVGKIPLVYASTSNVAVAYFWKIAMNETAKIPTFNDAIPEACHNELSGFDVVPTTASISKNLVGVFLHDSFDHPRNEKRLSLVRDLMSAKGYATADVNLEGGDRYSLVLSGVLMGVAAALALSHGYGVPDAKTPLIADFKKKMKS